MERSKFLDTAIVVFGFLSFMSMIVYVLALHDISWDYASPAVWDHAGKSLPDWYSPGNRCPGEWGALQVGFLLMLTFHVLLFVRLVRNAGTKASA